MRIARRFFTPCGLKRMEPSFANANSGVHEILRFYDLTKEETHEYIRIDPRIVAWRVMLVQNYSSASVCGT